MFYEDFETNTFGKKVMKRGSIVYQAASDFRFDLKMKVTSMNSDASGYIIDLYPEKAAESPQTPPM